MKDTSSIISTVTAPILRNTQRKPYLESFEFIQYDEALQNNITILITIESHQYEMIIDERNIETKQRIE